MFTTTKNVIVIGSDHHNTLGVVESLGEKGIKPIVIITSSKQLDKSYVLKSKYCRKNSYSTTYNKLIVSLKGNFEGLGKYIVITCSDPVAALLDNHYHELSSFLFLMGTGKQGELEYWMDKTNMIRLANAIGMNAPRTKVMSQDTGSWEYNYPCIMKSISTLTGGKTNLRICHDKNELNDALLNEREFEAVQVQEFIEKDFEFQFIGCSINSGETVIIPGRTHIDRPNGIDNTFALRYLPLDDTFNDTLSKAKSFIQNTGYSGLFSMEFIRDKRGNDWFLEMNFRNDGNAYCVTASGTNLPYIWISNVEGDNMGGGNKMFKPITFTPFIHYYYNMLQGEISFVEWLKTIFKTTKFACFFRNDVKPCVYHLRIESKGMLKTLGCRILRRNKYNNKEK